MSRRTLAAGCVLLAVVLWGAAVVGTKIALAEVPPLTLAFLRFLIASGLFLLVLRLGRVSRPAGHSLPWRRLFLLALAGVPAFYVPQNVGMVYTTAANAGLILGGVPALTAVLSVLFLRERIDLLRVSGIAGAIVGVAIIVLAGGTEPGENLSWLGNSLLLVSALAWAAYTVLGKDLGDRVPPLLVSAAVIFLGTVQLVPFAGYELLREGLPTISPAGWLAVLFLAVGPSCLAYLLWNYGLLGLAASEAGAYTNLAPVVSLLCAALFLHEAIVLPQVLGGALTLVGVYLAGYSKPALSVKPAAIDA